MLSAPHLNMTVHMTVEYDGLSEHDLGIMDHDDKIRIEQVYFKKNPNVRPQPMIEEFNEWLEALQRRPDYQGHRIRQLNSDSIIVVYTLWKAKALPSSSVLVERSTRSVDV